jgi:hypothetical protein
VQCHIVKFEKLAGCSATLRVFMEKIQKKIPKKNFQKKSIFFF